MLKNIKITLLTLFFSSLLISVAWPKIASAEHRKCWLSLQGGREASLVACPETLPGTTAPGGQTPDPSKCYVMSGPQLRATGTMESDCSLPRYQDPEHEEEALDSEQNTIENAECDDSGKCCDSGGDLTAENCVIVDYILIITRVLSGLVGLVIVIMIAYGGIQYTMARDDPQAVSAAKNRIRNAIFALVFYLFSIAFLQWLVPGGIF